MNRLFGWDLPPGVSSRDIEEAFGDDEEAEAFGASLDEEQWTNLTTKNE